MNVNHEFFAIIVVTLVMFAFFNFSKNASLKKVIWPVFILALSGIALWYVKGDIPKEPWFFPIFCLIVFLNIASVKFCNSCGRTIWHAGIIVRVKHCSHCGAEL